MPIPLLQGVPSFFMIADASQIVARGALQSLKDKAMPIVIAVATICGLGVPAAVMLGFVLDLGRTGSQSGMAVAMTGAAWFLIRRFRRQVDRFCGGLAAVILAA